MDVWEVTLSVYYEFDIIYQVIHFRLDYWKHFTKSTFIGQNIESPEDDWKKLSNKIDNDIED